MIHSIKKLISVCVLTILMSGSYLCANEYVGGIITANTTFTPSLNDYIVIESLIIPEGVTLTILPGTRLKFMVGSSIQVNQGNLIAQGTLEKPVIFEAFDPVGTHEKIWEGIFFNNAQSVIDENNQYISGSRLKYAEISGTTTGLTLNDTSVLITEHIKIENCNFGIQLQTFSRLLLSESMINSCSFGVSIRTSSDNRITNCNIINCDIGINFASNHISRNNLIENNNISYNRNVALFLGPGSSGIQYNYIVGNTVTNNNIGLHIGNSGAGDNGYNVVSHNIVQNNDIGIRVSQDRDTLDNNLVENNGNGIFLSKASFNDIRNNIIRNSSEWAVTLTEKSNGNILQQNNIYSNHSAIKITFRNESQSINNTIRNNSIINNQQETFLIESGPQQSIEFNTIIALRDTASFINRHPADVWAMNNYWGTVDTIRIDSIISDKYDYAQFGEVKYKPFLEIPTPESPISQPTMVVKRLIKNEVLVTWNINKESDLAGYKVYYGSDPVQVINNSLDTSIVISGIMLTETIKVTAYDSLANGISDMLQGHESAFSYAIAGPYAGEDNSICGDEIYFTSAATAIDYQSIQWLSEGDGSFADVSMLHTYYIPGPADIEAGLVDLSLTLVTNSGVSLSDKLHLLLLDHPILNAGNDTIIIGESTYSTEKAIALEYTELEWSTSGDGIFEDPDTLITNYTPGNEDRERGWVILTLKLSSGCGELVDYFKLTLIPGYDISGTIVKESSPVSGAIIVAYSKINENTRATTITTSDNQGYFNLLDMPEGDYYLYAIPDPMLYKTHIPTYYASRFNWHDAYLVPLKTDIYDVDIELKHLDLVLYAGDGSISGIYNYDGEPQSDNGVYNRVWFGDISAGKVWNQQEPYPASNHVVLLMNPDLTKILGWTLTEPNGTFTFANLPYGAYRLWGEKAGYTNKLSSIIYLTPDQKEVTDIELMVNQHNKMIEANIPLMDHLGSAQVFPNPATKQFNIDIRGFEGEEYVEICLIDEKGTLVMAKRVQRTSQNSFGPVDISNLHQGIYCCIIKTTNHKVVVKLAVK